MDDFSAKPGVPNAYGLIGGDANAVEPGKRPLSSMSPTIVLKDGKVVLVTGSPGGSRIITTVLQIVMNVIDHGMNIAEASAAPRMHHQWLPDELRVEEGFSPDTIRLLEGMGYTVKLHADDGLDPVDPAARGRRALRRLRSAEPGSADGGVLRRHEPSVREGDRRGLRSTRPAGQRASEPRHRARPEADRGGGREARAGAREAQAAEDREKIAAAQRELRYWTARRQTAELQPPPADCDEVRFGCKVTIERDDGRTQTFRIVGEDEADPAAGTLSYVAPLARALIGKEVGDVVKVGPSEAEILKIEWDRQPRDR